MHPVLNALFGGWGIGSIVTWSSGRPYSVTIGGNPANDFFIDVLGGVAGRKVTSSDTLDFSSPVDVTTTDDAGLGAAADELHVEFALRGVRRQEMRKR